MLAREYVPNGDPAHVNWGSLGAPLIPDTDNSYDLGSATKEWKDLYLQGNVILSAGDIDLGQTQKLITDDDDDSYITSNGDDSISMYIGGTQRVLLGTGANLSISAHTYPSSTAYTLGTAANPWGNTFLAGYIRLQEMTAPGNAPTDQAYLYLDVSGAKTTLNVHFQSGAVQQLAIEP